jgi:hypothetical protein
MAAALTAEPQVFRQIHGHARALVTEAVTAGRFEAWLALVPEDVNAASRALTIAAEAAGSDVRLRGLVAERARAVHAERFEDRYRLLVPLAGDDEGRAIVARVAVEDHDADLRAEAVRALRGSGAAKDTLERALRDPMPRVRAEAVSGLAGYAPARAAITDRLAHDRWPSVQRAAAEALAGDEANAPALLAALDAESVMTVRAAIEALSRTPGAQIGARLMSYAESGRNNPELRVEAIDAVAHRCDRPLAERMLALFNRENDPVLPMAEQMVGQRALAAAAHLDPARVRRAMREVQANAFGMAAIARAMRDACPAPR